MSKREKYIKGAAVIVCELFTVVTIIMLFSTAKYDRLFLAFLTLFIVLVPPLGERILKCKISLPVYLYAMFYTLGPMLGQSYDLYYTVWWWDKLLHISGGVMFALLGIYICDIFIEKSKRKEIFTAIFALCFSMAIAVVWEFAEFGSDTLLCTDMQDDTVITSINSYLLDDRVGVAGSVDDIQSVIINGKALPVDGYIDIGLIDSMLDMMLETLGALAAAVVYLIDKGKHPAFVFNK